MIVRFGGAAFVAALAVLTACGGGAGGDAGPRIPTRLQFISSPGFPAAGSVFTPPPVVVALDGNGARVSDYTGTVHLTLDSAGVAVALAGTVTVPAVAGAARFTDLSVTKTGFLYTLIASAPGLIPDTCLEFTVIAAAGYRLEFVAAPEYASAGSRFVMEPAVVVLDSFGNLSPVTATVTLGLLGGPGALQGTRVVTANLGLAPYWDLYVDSAGAGYRLLATSPGLQPDTSASFNVF